MPVLSSYIWIAQVNVIFFSTKKITTQEPEADDGKSDSLPPAATSVPPAEPLKQVPDCAKV